MRFKTTISAPNMHFRVEMESMPPVRVQEVQAKQLEIVQIARQMQDDERISLAIVSAGPGAN